MFDLPDDELLSLSKEHVFWTWSAQARVSPLPVKTAKGVYFWDTAGKRYLDFNSMTMCVNIGHGDERVVDAMVAQARELPYAAPGMATNVRAIASQLVAEVSPGGQLTKVLFTLGGADANENAIKLARGYTGRFKILTRYRSYHGASAGAMALTGDPRRVAWEPGLMPGVVHFLDPYRYRSTFHRTNPAISEADFCQDYLNHLEGDHPLRGPGNHCSHSDRIRHRYERDHRSSGWVSSRRACIMRPVWYRDDCGRSDERIWTHRQMVRGGSLGRGTGYHDDGKGAYLAYAPLGAVAMKPEIAAAFNERTFESGLTYTAHPVSLAAAVANINVMREDKLVEHAAAMGPVLNRMLKDLGEAHPSVGEVRSIGLFGIIELVRDRQTREPMTPWNGSSPEMSRLRKTCLEHGLYVYTHWHTVLIIPPLPITEAQLQEGFAVLDEALGETDKAVNKL